MERWNEIETVMKELVESGKTEEADAFFFTTEGTGPIPKELEAFREEILESFGDYELLWSETHPYVGNGPNSNG